MLARLVRLVAGIGVLIIVAEIVLVLLEASERDSEYLRETPPALRLLSSVYFRADVRGISVAEPVLRVKRSAHDLVFKVPGARAPVRQHGTIPASRRA